MPDAGAAHDRRRPPAGGESARRRAGCRFVLLLPMLWVAVSIAMADAAGSPANAARPAAQLPVPVPVLPANPPPIPGFHAPPPDSSTSVSGRVRAQPAHMPFYVAAKGTTTIYLLGTLHIGDPSDYPSNQPFRPPILAALAASPTLALELSPDDLIASQDDVSKYGVCSYDCLPRLLPPPLWRKLATRLRGDEGALAEIRRTRPWLAALLVETYSSLAAGLQTEYGTEAQLQNVYLRSRGKVVGLETLAEQMRAFTNLTLAQQREMLEQDLQQTPAETVADVKALHRLWRVGDADAIAAWSSAKSERLASSSSVARSLDNRIVYERNRRFTSRIVQLAAPNKPVFVAIGALHLGGPKGVLALLQRQGFTVEPS